jgi:death-on-curing family protein
MKDLTIQEVEQTAFLLAKQHLAFNEPIPDFSTRYPNSLESCLAMPFMKIGGAHLYKGLIGQASVLFYLMIKNHPFQNGNKRIAIMTLLVLLYKNGKWLKVDIQNMYLFTLWVAESLPEVKDATIQGIGDFFRKYIVDFPKKHRSQSKA